MEIGLLERHSFFEGETGESRFQPWDMFRGWREIPCVAGFHGHFASLCVAEMMEDSQRTVNSTSIVCISVAPHLKQHTQFQSLKILTNLQPFRFFIIPPIYKCQDKYHTPESTQGHNYPVTAEMTCPLSRH